MRPVSTIKIEADSQQSKQWIEGDYLPWDPIPGLDDDDRDEEDDSDDDDVVDDEELEEEGTGTEDSYGRR